MATGSGTDQCSQVGSASSSSWARSQTVTTSAGRLRDVVEQLRVGVGEVEPGAPPGGHGARVDAFGRVGAGAVGGLVGQLRPQGGGQLGSSRVVGAHEQRRLGPPATAGEQTVEGVAVEVDVTAAAVTAGAAAGDQPDLLEHVEVVGEKVGRDAGEALELDGGAIRASELVDDGQAGRIAERGVALRSNHHRIHSCRSILAQSEMSQEVLNESFGLDRLDQSVRVPGGAQFGLAERLPSIIVDDR